MHAPVRELLKRQDVAALDVPTEPRATLNRVGAETAGYTLPAGFYKTPKQGRLHPALDPDADVEANYDSYNPGQ